MNKKGALLLRDVVFILLIFGGVMALISIFVIEMGNEYSNTNMTNEYTSSGKTNYSSSGVRGLGDVVSEDIDDSVTEMRAATSEGESNMIGGFGNFVIGIVDGATEIVKIVFSAPVMIGNTIEVLMVSLNIPDDVAGIISNLIIGLIYVMIIVVLLTAALRGGKI